MTIALDDFAVPQEDQFPFAKFLAFVAQVDAEVTLEEKHALDDLLMAWGFDEEQVLSVYGILEKGCDIDSLASEFSARKTPYLLIQELVTLAGLDGSYDDSEKNAIRLIADSCGVSRERVAAIEKWVEEGLSWRAKGVELVQPEGE